MFGNLKMSEVFAQADSVLTTAAKGIAEIITRTGHINVDFQDVSTVMSNSGVAVMGAAVAEGDNRAIKAVENALSSPLLNDNDIKGARFILLNMEFGSEEITMDEIADITDFIQDEAGATADIIWGYGQNEEMGDGLSVTLIATGFELAGTTNNEVLTTNSGKTVHSLEDAEPQVLTNPLASNTPKVNPVIQKPTTPEPFLKNEESQGRIEFSLDSKKKEEQKATPPAEPLSPFIKPASETPPVPKMEEPKPFVPQQPVAQTPEVSEPAQPTVPSAPASPVNDEGQQTRVKNRMGRLKELSRRLRTASGLSELEDVPAYQRRAVSLEDVPHSSESQVSRYSLDETETEDGKKTGISNNNSFLHDNVD
jgi:cell division protein FtsZ